MLQFAIAPIFAAGSILASSASGSTIPTTAEGSAYVQQVASFNQEGDRASFVVVDSGSVNCPRGGNRTAPVTSVQVEGDRAVRLRSASNCFDRLIETVEASYQVERLNSGEGTQFNLLDSRGKTIYSYSFAAQANPVAIAPVVNNQATPVNGQLQYWLKQSGQPAGFIAESGMIQLKAGSNVRSRPTASASLVTTLGAGNYRIAGRVGRVAPTAWYLVQMGDTGRAGWVHASNIEWN